MAITLRSVKGSALTHNEMDTNFQETRNTGGWGFYSDSSLTVGSGQSIATSASVFTTVENDGANFTVEELPFDTTDPLWNVVTDKFEPYILHDTFDLRFRATVENYSGSSPYLDLEIEAGGTSGAIEGSTIPLLKNGDAQTIDLAAPIFVGSDALANGLLIKVRYDGTGSLDLYGVKVYIERKYKQL